MELHFPGGQPAGIIVATVSGELDLYSASEFASFTLDRMKKPLRAAVLDLSDVSYIDSSGTGAIIRILFRARGMGAQVFLSGLRRGPRQVLNMVNLLSLIRDFGTRAEAIAFAEGEPCSSAGN